MIDFTYLLLAQRHTGLVALLASLASLASCASCASCAAWGAWGEREGERERGGVFLCESESVVEVVWLGGVSKLSLFSVFGIDPVLPSGHNNRRRKQGDKERRRENEGEGERRREKETKRKEKIREMRGEFMVTPHL